jgi:hypothetical protein
VILGLVVVTVVAILLVGGVVGWLVQEARADERVSSSWRDQNFRDEGRRDG